MKPIVSPLFTIKRCNMDPNSLGHLNKHIFWSIRKMFTYFFESAFWSFPFGYIGKQFFKSSLIVRLSFRVSGTTRITLFELILYGWLSLPCTFFTRYFLF